MEVNQASDSSQEVTQVSSEATTPTPAPSPEPTQQVDAQPTSTMGGEVIPPQPPLYQPNFKYTAGKKEYEIPEYLRSSIKDEKTEKEIKEIFEKAHGIDFVKNERARVQEEYKSYKSQVEPIMQIASEINRHVSRGDVFQAAKLLGFTEQDVLKAALQYAEIQNLPQDQKQVYDQHREAEIRAYQLERQLEMERQEKQQIFVQQRQAELEQVLGSPEISAIQKAFDQRRGEGAFRQELIARGQMYWHTRQQDVPPAQLAKEMADVFGHLAQIPAQQPQAAMSAQGQQPTAPQQVPVIPNTGSGVVSPAARKPTSIDDLRKIAKEKFG